ncbi:PAS/PAC sensor signal transduction histidine kinase [Geobacter metallireducens RCH3]|uniref:histidine kinase n=1 Tax=Geobacter metallireducens (strain ATCC 53774 / DSM 7210 / GS-15) TaxID=269799 RepID=Q39XQ1_GEOMG|nr:PAS domain S-box protein [Geobacter metallireducens]ABB30973.1 sensor histidine kinase, PAS domain-containing [Geobacter metallireducens GS-15]EHP84449.1 PAS/PAC sensor signal transduction histidine kinase [Geobacter metallireducens RCH3]
MGEESGVIVELQREIEALRERIRDFEAREAECILVHQELFRARREWESIFQGIAHPTVILDSRHVVVAANRAVVKAAGTSEGEIIGRKCYEVFHNSGCTEPPRVCPMEMMLLSNGEETIEVEAEAFGGVFLVSCTPVFDDGGKVDKIIHIATDITARKRAEESLRESEERYRIVADYSSDWDFWLSPEGTLSYVSPACLDITGYAPAEFYADPSLNAAIVHPDDREMIARHNEEAMSSNEKSAMELRIITKGGETRWIFHVCQTVYDSEGKSRGRRASNRDITALKRVEEENRRLHAELELRVMERTAQLEAANRELESFCYSVSHDLRAPLRHIEGFSSILIEDCAEGLDETGKGYLDRVVRATRRMDELVDALLRLSRYTRDYMTFEPVDLSDMTREIMGEFTKSNPERKVTITIQEGLRAMGDARLLRVVMENLLGNAWKFTGKIEEGEIEFGREERDGRGVLFVRDNGAGFDMAYVDKLFNAFQRLHGSDEFEGTGIGLATVQRIIHRHGGEVWAHAAPNRGATFSFTLPPA